MKKAGIITLLIFSMPLEIPKMRMAAVMTTTTMCHGTLERCAPLIWPKKVSGSVFISVPVSAPAAERTTQPTMMA